MHCCYLMAEGNGWCEGEQRQCWSGLEDFCLRMQVGNGSRAVGEPEESEASLERDVPSENVRKLAGG